MPSIIWLIPGLPIAGFLVIVFLTFGRPRLSGLIAIATIGAAFICSLLTLVIAIDRKSVV